LWLGVTPDGLLVVPPAEAGSGLLGQATQHSAPKPGAACWAILLPSRGAGLGSAWCDQRWPQTDFFSRLPSRGPIGNILNREFLSSPSRRELTRCIGWRRDAARTAGRRPALRETRVDRVCLPSRYHRQKHSQSTSEECSGFSIQPKLRLILDNPIYKSSV
jgi:hypothetical protein